MCQQTGSGIWRKGDILMQRSAARSPNRIRRTKGEVVFDTVNYIVLSLLGIITLYPIINVLAISLSSYTGYLQNPAMILPAEFNLDAYKTILSNPLIMSSYSNTITVALLGTVINVVLTVVTAYPLAKEKVRGSRALMFGIVFTMMFSGGIIPTFLVVRSLHLLDTLWALILPCAMTTTNFIIVKNFFENIPDSIEESAKMDGAGDFRILWTIVVPLSIPVLATVTLFYAVSNWNRLFDAVMYINSRSNWTLPILLKEIITENSDLLADPSVINQVMPKTMQCATIVVTILPIMLVYPFLQRYFMKGIMLGAVKG
jgi:putative aldouronate transport system permease protein